MLRGDERAFNTFFNTYFPRLYRFALPRLNGDIEATKEVVQATLTKAVANVAEFRAEAALFSWMCQICRRQIIDYSRARRRDARIVFIDDSAELRAVMDSIEAADESDPSHRYSTAETRQLIQALLDRLPARYGDVLEWKYVEGYSVAEIGQRLGVSETAAQSMLARARVAFRQSIETLFGAETAEVLASLRTDG